MRARAAAFARGYRAALGNRPLATNVATAVPLMVAGDITAQHVESRSSGWALTELDAGRTAVMASYSAFIFTPTFLTLYRWLDK